MLDLAVRAVAVPHLMQEMLALPPQLVLFPTGTAYASGLFSNPVSKTFAGHPKSARLLRRHPQASHPLAHP